MRTLQRLYQLGFLLAGLSAATLACAAVPTARDPDARAKRTQSARSESPSSTKQSTSTEGQSVRQSTVVVVDAGHGGHDRGGIPGQRVAEKSMTLDVAQRLRAALQANGYRVVMTRNSDVFVPLGTRVAIANSYRNAIFVAVHFNSARRSGANGIETYFYSRDSLALASAIHYYVVGTTPSMNRGVRRRGFYVLRRTRIPAVLVECGFLTNPTEARNAQNSAYRQKLADAIARGVASRGSVSRTSTGTHLATIPLQPFLDQTRVSRKRSGKRSKKRRSSKSKKKRSAQSGNVIGYYIAADRAITAIRAEG